MRKKILDTACLLFFLLSLTVMSNIQEEGKLQEPFLTEMKTSEHSFTPESDEKTVKTAAIAKREIVIVGAPFERDKSELTEEDLEATEEDSGSIEEISEPTEKDSGSIEETSEPAEEDSGLIEETSEPTEEDSGSIEETSEPIEEHPEATEENHINAEPQPAGNRWDIALTAEEINLLARILWIEARGEPVEGQYAVVEVIFNRMASEQYPNTLYEVLSQGNPVQFCSWKSRESAMPTEKEFQSIDNVLTGKTELLRNDTMYFSTFPLTEHVEKKIGGHYFCY